MATLQSNAAQKNEKTSGDTTFVHSYGVKLDPNVFPPAKTKSTNDNNSWVRRVASPEQLNTTTSQNQNECDDEDSLQFVMEDIGGIEDYKALVAARQTSASSASTSTASVSPRPDSALYQVGTKQSGKKISFLEPLVAAVHAYDWHDGTLNLEKMSLTTYAKILADKKESKAIEEKQCQNMLKREELQRAKQRENEKRIGLFGVFSLS